MKVNTPLVAALKNYFHLNIHLQSVRLEELEESTGYSPEEIRDGLDFLLKNYKGLKGRIQETESRFIVEENSIYCENEELRYEQQSLLSYSCPSCGKTSCIWCFGPRIILEQPVCPACFKKMPVDSIYWKDDDKSGTQSRFVKALALVSENRVLQASRELETIDLESNISNKAKTAVLLALGICYLSLKKNDKAWKSFKRVQQIDPKEPLVHIAMGLTYEMDERDEKALEKYRDALEIEPDNPMVHIVMGNLLEVLARNYEALAAYKKAIELDPTNADYWVNLGDFYDLAEQDEEAEEAYIKATELEPDNPEIWKILGFFYEVRDMKVEAAMCYTKVVRLSPEDDAAANYMNTYMRTSENIIFAKESYQQVLSLENPETWNELARSYREIGNYEQAIHFYEKSLKKDPSQLKILKEIAGLYKSTEQFEKADELFEKIEKLEKIYQTNKESVNSKTHNLLQETLDFISASQRGVARNGALIQGMPWEEVQVVAVTDPSQQAYKQLIEYLEKILLFNPGDKGTLAKLASIYKKIGNMTKFDEYWQRLRALESQVTVDGNSNIDDEIDQ